MKVDGLHVATITIITCHAIELSAGNNTTHALSAMANILVLDITLNPKR